MSFIRCYCADQICRQTPPVPDRPDDLVFPISISTAVGQGGANDPRDVRTIQQALNRLQLEQGGPAPPLNPDGIAGPKTRAAISKFQLRQLGFADARVDPNGRTIGRSIDS